MQNKLSDIPRQPVFLDMDGSMDDMLSLITLLSLPGFKLSGVAVTNGNCYADDAAINVLRIASLFEENNLEVAISKAEGQNPFPAEWREKSRLITNLGKIAKQVPDISKISKNEAAEFTAEKINAEQEKTTVVVTGPATNLINTIEQYPSVLDKIDKVLWMAGAFLANGNVIAPDHDGSAEWNIFWDPVAAQKLIRMNLKIILFPLDVCNQVPVDNYLMYHLKKHSKHKASKLALKILELATANHPEYYMWDVLPSLYLGFPNFIRLSNTSIDIEQRGTSKGNIFKTSKGAPIYFASCIDDEKFYGDFIELMKRH